MSCKHEHGELSCEEIFARLSEYLDGELDERESAILEEHMKDCPPCVDFMRSLENTVSLVGEAAPPKMPDELKQAICAAYRKAGEGSDEPAAE